MSTGRWSAMTLSRGRFSRRSMSRGRPLATLAAVALGGLITMGCDDQIKYIGIFSTMSEQVSIEPGEEVPRTSVPGTMPIDGERIYGLLEADTALVSPIAGDSAEIALGQERFEQFCTPCHGSEGLGDGPVVGPNRIPPIPTLDLTTDRAVGYTDGYIWGMISNGRGLMPSYHRIPVGERWRIVAYVRQLQQQAAEGGGAAGATAAGGAAVGAGAEGTMAGGQP
jgi:mono/diheme cytochrome c family protein